MADLAHLRRRIGLLEGHEAWEALIVLVSEMRKEETEKLAKSLIAGATDFDRVKLAYLQGKYAGMEKVLDMPREAAKAAMQKESGS